MTVEAKPRIEKVDPKDIDLRDINIVTLVGVARNVNKWYDTQSKFRSLKFHLEVRDYHDQGEWWKRTSYIRVLCVHETALRLWDEVSEGARVSVIGKLAQNDMRSEEGHRAELLTVEADRIKKLQDRQEVSVIDALDAMNKRVQERREQIGVIEKPILDLEEVLEEALDEREEGLDESAFDQGMVDTIIANGPDDDDTGFAGLGSFEATSGKIENVLGPEKDVNEYDPFR